MLAAAWVASLLTIDPRFPQGLARMQLPPPAAGLSSWADDECGRCHRVQAEQHAASGHASARSGFVFQASVSAERPEWCVGCHAPLASDARSRAPPDGSAAEAGVGCAACHAGVRGVLAVRPSSRAPHAVEVSAALTDGTLCAGCHEFGFLQRDTEGVSLGLSPTRLQQSTVTEWRAWQSATGSTETCWGCHAGESGHALRGHRSETALREAVTVEVTGRTLTVRARGVGHRLPTGDVMRWLSVEASPDGFFEAKPAAVAAFAARLGRRTWPGEEAPHLGIVSDLRLEPDRPVRVELPPGTRAWQLTYHLVADEHEGSLMSPAASRIVLHAGTLNPRGER